jgi:hypothetical protein
MSVTAIGLIQKLQYFTIHSVNYLVHFSVLHYSQTSTNIKESMTKNDRSLYGNWIKEERGSKEGRTRLGGMDSEIRSEKKTQGNCTSKDSKAEKSDEEANTSE